MLLIWESASAHARLAMAKRCYFGVTSRSPAAPAGPGKETIADAAHRLQKDRLGGIVFNITAQADHEVVDGARVGVLAHPPDLLQQLLAGDDAALVEDKIAEQVATPSG